MLIPALFGLLFVVVGVAGLQFVYMFSLERLHLDRKKYLRQIEAESAELRSRLKLAEKRIAEQDALLAEAYPDLAADEESWAEVLEDR